MAAHDGLWFDLSSGLDKRLTRLGTALNAYGLLAVIAVVLVGVVSGAATAWFLALVLGPVALLVVIAATMVMISRDTGQPVIKVLRHSARMTARAARTSVRNWRIGA